MSFRSDASIAADTQRRYSRLLGLTSEPSTTVTSGQTSWMISRARRSCAGFTVDQRKQTAMASTLYPLSTRVCSRTASSSSGVSTPPSELMRSLTGSVR